MQADARSEPPQILQIVREPIKPGQEDAYRVLEEETAQISAVLGCPHPYLAAETLTGAKEIWWLNGYRSSAEQAAVADAYAMNAPLLSALQRQSRRKSALTLPSIEVIGRHRPDLSAGAQWTRGRSRFLVITPTNSGGTQDGTVFELADGSHLVINAFQTLDEARIMAEAESTVFMIRPAFSFPAREWIASDPPFWRAHVP